jgi:hypothetical protein
MTVQRGLLILALLIPGVLAGSNPIAASPNPYGVGEKLTYDLTWFGIHVGTGVLEVESREDYGDRDAFRVVSSAKSNKVLSVFFPVDDRVESTMDADEAYSYYIRVIQRHGARIVDKTIRFNHETRTATMVYKGKTREFPIVNKAKDSLSSLYFFRTIKDLRIGDSVYIDVHESKKNWRLEVEILGREEITVPMGTFNTLKTKAKVRYEGVLMDKGDVFVWVSDDNRKIPVLIKGKVSIGPFTASLSSGVLPELSAMP